MRIRIEVATAPRTGELLDKNKAWKNRNDLVTFNDVSIETESFRWSRLGVA